MSSNARVLIEVTIAAPIDAVWQAVRDPAEINRWFGWEYDGLADEIDMIFIEGATASEGTYEVSWEHGDRFVLEPRGDQTILRVTRAAPADGSDWQAIYDDVSEGWTTFVQQLRFALNRHPGQDRRTLYFSGNATDPSAAAPIAALGFEDAATLSAGSRYDLTAPTGERLSGAVWYRSKRQAGFTVDGYGDGLLVITEEPESSRPPYGGGTAVITTYGLADRALEQLRQQWTEWWDAHYKQA